MGQHAAADVSVAVVVADGAVPDRQRATRGQHASALEGVVVGNDVTRQRQVADVLDPGADAHWGPHQQRRRVPAANRQPRDRHRHVCHDVEDPIEPLRVDGGRYGAGTLNRHRRLDVEVALEAVVLAARERGAEVVAAGGHHDRVGA